MNALYDGIHKPYLYVFQANFITYLLFATAFIAISVTIFALVLGSCHYKADMSALMHVMESVLAT